MRKSKMATIGKRANLITMGVEAPELDAPGNPGGYSLFAAIFGTGVRKFPTAI